MEKIKVDENNDLELNFDKKSFKEASTNKLIERCNVSKISNVTSLNTVNEIYTFKFKIINTQIVYKSETFHKMLLNYYKLNPSDGDCVKNKTQSPLKLENVIKNSIEKYVFAYIDLVYKHEKVKASTELINLINLCTRFSGLEMFFNNEISFSDSSDLWPFLILKSKSRYHISILYLLMLNVLYRFGFYFILENIDTKIVNGIDELDKFRSLSRKIETNFNLFRVFYFNNGFNLVNSLHVERVVDKTDFCSIVRSKSNILKFFREIQVYNDIECTKFMNDLLQYNCENIYMDCKYENDNELDLKDFLKNDEFINDDYSNYVDYILFVDFGIRANLYTYKILK